MGDQDDGARNLALLSVAYGLGGMASSVHGILADTLGFQASYFLALGLTAAALCLVARLRRLI
jgi:hypothetical protein